MTLGPITHYVERDTVSNVTLLLIILQNFLKNKHLNYIKFNNQSGIESFQVRDFRMSSHTIIYLNESNESLCRSIYYS
jgi:hypothetical protein